MGGWEESKMNKVGKMQWKRKSHIEVSPLYEKALSTLKPINYNNHKFKVQKLEFHLCLRHWKF